MRLALTVYAAAFSTWGCAPRGVPSPPSPTADARFEAEDATKVFRHRAGAGVAAVRLAMEHAAFDPRARASLMPLLDAHSARVETEVRRMRANQSSADQLIESASALADRFDRDVLEPWGQANPDAFTAVEAQMGVWEAVSHLLVNAPDRLVDAALTADLPPEPATALRKLVWDTRNWLKSWNDEALARQRRIAQIPHQDARKLAEIAFEAEMQQQLFDSGVRLESGMLKLLPERTHPVFREQVLDLAAETAE